MPELLVVAGKIKMAGDEKVEGIAAWDGQAWQSLGSGVKGEVRALAVYENQLVAAGAFSKAGGVSCEGLARWDGKQWQSLGGDWAPQAGQPRQSSGGRAARAANRQFDALVVYEGHLIVGGDFSSSGPDPCRNIARWDGQHWQPLGEGLDGPVSSLLVYKGQLVAGGLFHKAGDAACRNVACWDGQRWQGLGGGTDGQVLVLGTYKGDLLAGGAFIQAGEKICNGVARWDGSAWQRLGDGPAGEHESFVSSLVEYRDTLVAGGSFERHQGHGCIVRWDGRGWGPLSAAVESGGVRSRPLLLAVYKGDLITAGAFWGSGAAACVNVARWDGRQFRPLASGMHGQMFAGTEYNGQLVLVGNFMDPQWARASHVVAWDGQSWRPLDRSMRLDPDADVHAVTVYNGWLVVGGKFFSSGRERIQNIAWWDGQAWHNVGQPPTDAVRSLAVYDGQLVAGGWGIFPEGGEAGTGSYLMARWDGREWRPLGVGLGSASSHTDRVNCLLVYQGHLVAGGKFRAIGDGRACNLVASWDGTEWHPMGGGMEGDPDRYPEVNGLAVYKGDLIAVGNFAKAGGVTCNNVARWDGKAWQAMDKGLDGAAWAAVEYRGELIVGGNYFQAGNKSCGNIAAWDGTAWQLPIPKVDGAVYALNLYKQDLVAGGAFSFVGGKISHGYARYGPVGAANPLEAAAPSASQTLPASSSRPASLPQ